MEDSLRTIIRASGLRATAPRLAVLTLLSNSTRPLSHTEVLEALGDQPWDQATVYRNLIKLTDAKITRVASTARGITRYELADRPAHTGDAHAHFVCVVCGNVSCLPETPVVQLPDEAWQTALETAEMQFVGTCPNCI